MRRKAGAALFEMHLALPVGMHPQLMKELIFSAAEKVVRLRVAPTSVTLRASGGVGPFVNRLVLMRDTSATAARTAYRAAMAPGSSPAAHEAALDRWSQCNLRAEHAAALLNALAGPIGALAASPAAKAPIGRQGSQTPSTTSSTAPSVHVLRASANVDPGDASGADKAAANQGSITAVPVAMS